MELVDQILVFGVRLTVVEWRTACEGGASASCIKSEDVFAEATKLRPSAVNANKR